MNHHAHFLAAWALTEMPCPDNRMPKPRMGESRARMEASIASTFLDVIKDRLKFLNEEAKELKEILRLRQTTINLMKTESRRILRRTLKCNADYQEMLAHLAPRVSNLLYQKNEVAHLEATLKDMKSEKRAYDRLYGIISSNCGVVEQ